MISCTLENMGHSVMAAFQEHSVYIHLSYDAAFIHWVFSCFENCRTSRIITLARSCNVIGKDRVNNAFSY